MVPCLGLVPAWVHHPLGDSWVYLSCPSSFPSPGKQELDEPGTRRCSVTFPDHAAAPTIAASPSPSRQLPTRHLLIFPARHLFPYIWDLCFH